MNDQPGTSSPLATANSSPFDVTLLFRGVAGAVLGGAVGFFVFRLLAAQGLYGIMIPGALVGLGAGLAARGKSIPLGIFCAAAALALSIYCEWSMFPFVKNKSFGFFLAHVHELPPTKLIMLGVGSLFAYWFGAGR